MKQLIHLTVAIAVFGSYASAQDDPNDVIYFLKDGINHVWCGYTSESLFRAQVRSREALILGQIDYKNDRIDKVQVTEADDTGDWAVNDEYKLAATGEIDSLKRAINILPEDLRIERLFIIRNGADKQQQSSYRELRSGKPTQKRAEWFDPPQIRTRLREFPFITLIDNRQTILSKGETCLSDTTPPPR